MWRPEGWKNPYETYEVPKIRCSEECNVRHFTYEAGADAIYQSAYDKGRKDEREDLKKDGDFIDIRGYGTQNVYYPKLLIKPAIGYVVFIPEEVL